MSQLTRLLYELYELCSFGSDLLDLSFRDDSGKDIDYSMRRGGRGGGKYDAGWVCERVARRLGPVNTKRWVSSFI